MQISNHFPLKEHNTFGIDVMADRLIEVESVPELQALLAEEKHLKRAFLVAGGLSNVLFLGDFRGDLIRIAIRGIRVVKETSETVIVRAAAGENWDGFVKTCVERGWGGLENLSLIPGNVGTSPVQNIGAYGVEARNAIEEVEAVEIETQELKTIHAADCRFGYRDSVFKNELKGRFIIVSVVFRLDKHPRLHLDYGNIGEELAAMGIKNPDIRSVREAVIRIRSRKLPDPRVVGNAGSFFKNPVVSMDQFNSLVTAYPKIVSFSHGESRKLAAAWLIEQCGWKGFREGDTGVHTEQPLVLVNYGQASGRQILDLSEKITASVREKFGVTLEREVNVIG